MESGLIAYVIGCTLIYVVSRQVEPGVQLVPSIICFVVLYGIIKLGQWAWDSLLMVE